MKLSYAYKWILKKIPITYLERTTALSLLNSEFISSKSIVNFKTREDLWKNLFDRFSNKAVDILEFGVFEGYSLNEFSSLNKHKASRFYGFDSFLGLPDDWNQLQKKGSFSLKGVVPRFKDPRIQIIKGWFQNTLHNFLLETEFKNNLIVHYDADLYSATLYTMLKLDEKKTPYYAIFDEFAGGEARALYNYMEMTKAKVEFIGSVITEDYPERISCKIIPQPIYSPDL